MEFLLYLIAAAAIVFIIDTIIYNSKKNRDEIKPAPPPEFEATNKDFMRNKQKMSSDASISMIRMATSWGCSPNEVKEYFLKEMIRGEDIPEIEYNKIMKLHEENKLIESEKYKINPEDTPAAFMEKWTKEYFEEKKLSKLESLEMQTVGDFISNNPEFKDIIQTGDENKIYEFICSNPDLSNSLMEKLYSVYDSVRTDNSNDFADDSNKRTEVHKNIKQENNNLFSPSEVKIGEQIWRAENLNVSHFRNGDPIPEARSIEDWRKAAELEKPAWCYYDNVPENGKIYGKLYNWYAVNDTRKLPPEGWHIPSLDEWNELTNFLGGESAAGGKLKEKGTIHWNYPNKGASNETHFSALPGGYRCFWGEFEDIGRSLTCWSSLESGKGGAWVWGLYFKHSEVSSYTNDKDSGCYVRCLKDNDDPSILLEEEPDLQKSLATILKNLE